MNPSVKRILFLIMVVLFLLAACAPAAQPTQNAVNIDAEVGTAVALTVAAQNAETRAAQSPTPQVTNTMLPTQTEVGDIFSPTPVLPTATALVIVPTTSSGGGGANATPKPLYACQIISRRPYDNTVFRPDADFDIRWTIVNTGTRTILAGTDVKYSSGENMTNTTRRELPEIAPGDQYEIIFDAIAPHKPGTYIMTWVVEGQLCYPYAAIKVER